MLVYDCEIVKMIQGKDDVFIDGIEYCDGWGDFQGMGISVICVYDYIDKSYRVFMQDNMEDFQDLINKREVLVGFNSLRFDNKLCAAHGIDLSKIQHYDLLLEVAKEANRPNSSKPSVRGCSLKACCKANFYDIDKNGDGAMAPLLWQKGQIGKVVDYCLNDVKMTKSLLDKVLNTPFIYCPKDNSELRLEILEQMFKYKETKEIKD